MHKDGPIDNYKYRAIYFYIFPIFVWAGVISFSCRALYYLYKIFKLPNTKGYHYSRLLLFLLNAENNKCNTLSFYRLNDCTSLVKRGVNVVHFTLRPVHDPGH